MFRPIGNEEEKVFPIHQTEIDTVDRTLTTVALSRYLRLALCLFQPKHENRRERLKIGEYNPCFYRKVSSEAQINTECECVIIRRKYTEISGPKNDVIS